MKTVRAIYEQGVFRPLEPVDLPEASEVLLQARTAVPRLSEQGRTRVHEILSRRFDSGETDVAARHDEHQP